MNSIDKTISSIDKTIMDSLSCQDLYCQCVFGDPDAVALDLSINTKLSQAVREMYPNSENVILKKTRTKGIGFFETPHKFSVDHVNQLLENAELLQKKAPENWKNIFQFDFVRHMILVKGIRNKSVGRLIGEDDDSFNKNKVQKESQELLKLVMSRGFQIDFVRYMILIKSIRNMRVGRSIDEDDDSFKNKVQKESQKLLNLAMSRGFQKRLFLLAHVETLLLSCKVTNTEVDEEGVAFATHSLIALCENDRGLITDEKIVSFLQCAFASCKKICGSYYDEEDEEIASYKKIWFYDDEKITKIEQLLVKCGWDEHIFAGSRDEAVIDFDSIAKQAQDDIKPNQESPEKSSGDIDELGYKGGDYIPLIDEDLINYGGDAGLEELNNHDPVKQEIRKRVPPLRLFVGGCVFVGVFLVFVYLLRKAYCPLKWSIVDLWWPEWFCLYPASGLW